ALGLTGVRGAYAIAPQDAADAVRDLARLCPSWPVGVHGVAMLQAWPGASVQAWLKDSVATLRGWKARQLALCEALGWACRPSHANFFVARPPGSEPLASPSGLLPFLRRCDVKLRDTTSFGLPGEVRLGVLPPASQDALGLAVHRWQASRAVADPGPGSA
ncbi:MAG: aminotransferase, partial [Rhodoferax sp.]|nr:aminotransferase [Rhodoferax sp.]